MSSRSFKVTKGHLKVIQGHLKVIQLKFCFYTDFLSFSFSFFAFLYFSLLFFVFLCFLCFLCFSLLFFVFLCFLCFSLQNMENSKKLFLNTGFVPPFSPLKKSFLTRLQAGHLRKNFFLKEKRWGTNPFFLWKKVQFALATLWGENGEFWYIFGRGLRLPLKVSGSHIC